MKGEQEINKRRARKKQNGEKEAWSYKMAYNEKDDLMILRS